MTMNVRRIPSSGEELPVIGCGTYRGFDHTPGTAEHARLPGVLDALFEQGGTVLDSSPMYGRAETTVGELLAGRRERDNAFVATKVWTSGRDAGIREMEDSMRKLGAEHIDLMQIHNLLDWRVHLPTLRKWKDAGKVRYIGITHYTSSAHAEIESIIRKEELDFLQINYSIDDRAAEQRLFPLAIERGVAVLVNIPFGGGGLLRTLRNKPLPGWAAEIGCASWSHVLLKFVLSQPAVTCVIPGSGDAEHMAANAVAGVGPTVDARFWQDKFPRV